ncbi:MAG: hypothetical protein ACOVNU_03025 [Candidatus Kapaibacteriota bacterium]
MLYEYKCLDCEKTTEEIRGVCERDKPLSLNCFDCASKTCTNFKRVEINRTSFELKGTGFHATDYK